MVLGKWMVYDSVGGLNPSSVAPRGGRTGLMELRASRLRIWGERRRGGRREGRGRDAEQETT
jgi:hypothetical protein